MEKSITHEDELKAENEVLKLKLEIEHGAIYSANMPAHVENQWLNQIYEFEKMHKNAGKIRIYDFIGKPAYKQPDTMQGDEWLAELTRINEILEENGIELNFSNDYEDELKYRFIVGEFFENETDDVRIPDMTSHFTYEDFHPNHESDLMEYSEDFVEDILLRKWEMEFSNYNFDEQVQYKGSIYSSEEASAIVIAFQESYKEFEVDVLEVKELQFDVEEGKASVNMNLAYRAKSHQNSETRFSGNVSIQYVYKYGFWYASGFSMPGMDV